MKNNRFLALAAAAVMALGLSGATVVGHTYAQGGPPTTLQTQAVSGQDQACAQDQADGVEQNTASDTDQVQLQCGDQSTADGQPEAKRRRG